MKTFICTLWLVIGFSLAAYAAPPIQRSGFPIDAEIVTVRGDSTVRLLPRDNWEPAIPRQTLTAGDTLKTGAYGKLDLLFADGTQIKVHHKTILAIKQVRNPATRKGTSLGLQSGEIWSRAKSTPDSLKIITPSATAAIRGTDWDIAVDEQGTSRLIVLKGTVELGNELGMVSVAAGETAMAEIGKAPVKMVLVSPKDRVQWITSYPFDVVRIVTYGAPSSLKTEDQIPALREKLLLTPADRSLRERLAGLLYNEGQYEESMRLFDELLQDEPGNSTALTFKGLILLDRGNTDKAVACFEQALKSVPDRHRTEALLGLAGVASRRNDLGQAENIVATLGKDAPAPVVGIAAASFRAFLGEFVQGVALCREYAGRYPADSRFQALAADLQLTMDDGPQARASLDRAFAINPNSAHAYATLGKYFYLEGNGREAEFAYRKALALDPGNANTRSELGRLLMERGDFEEAELLLDEATALAPRQHTGWSRRGMLMNWIDDLRGAKRDFSQALDLNPSDYESLDGLGYQALKEGRTGDAISYFQKAGTIEPKFAQPHVFLAIAYYQIEEVEKALEELRLAEALDPKDPLPHMIAYIIYSDTYRPFQSISEAGRALELLPNLKSVNPIEKTQQGISNLGSSLLGLGMTEWATSYAEESFDPFDASGYFFVSKKFADNPMVYVSENVQGFLVDPLAIGQHLRYQEIVAKPHHDLRVNTTVGDEDGSFARNHKITLQGFDRKPFDFKYLLDFENTDSQGFRHNGFVRDNFLTYALSAKPDYKNGLIIYGGVREKKYGDPGSDNVTYEANDTNRSVGFELDAGYNRRLENKNNLFFNFRYSRTTLNYTNPDPYGTGLNDVQLSLIEAFGLEKARAYLKQEVFDFTNETTLVGPWTFPFFGTDSTGVVRQFPALFGAPVSSALPLSIDPNTTVNSRGVRESYNYQLKQLVQLGDSHQLSWGIEYAPIDFEVTSTYSAKMAGTGVFREDYLQWALSGTPTPWQAIPLMHIQNYGQNLNMDSSYVGTYIHDRWKPTGSLLIDAGLFYEYFSNDLNKNHDFNPRLGFAWKFHKQHMLRAAFQKRTMEAFDITLAPVTTAGLFFDWVQLFPGSRVTDYQAALESRWGERLFTSVGGEIRDYKHPVFEYNFLPSENRAVILSAAGNAILTDRLGAFVRYKYTESNNHGELHVGKATPLVPMHTLGAGLVYVSPSHFKAALSTAYAARQYGDEANLYRLPEIWTTDFSATWELRRKHVMLRLDLKNIFDRQYETEMNIPAAGRAVYLTMEYRF